MSLDNLNNVELLTAKEIEERIADAKIQIETITKKISILGRSSRISNEEYNTKSREMNKNIEKLEGDIKAYHLALDAVPEDYN